ncbi:Na+/H+ antiporter NhaA [Flavobacterium aurantiibacter]|uniref:Na(+)/H(+) antiporter NhaA n=1 Tax=Flavobacterium aurantiibacter TaxID=2023067 RepID=A0A255ZQ08_9FLAO|nr:Na+/H+ antiporter NhaA [Flavobacterium aurantiibacter]OYQ43588.1 Na+/H+ antiporter NhaA [Flavobacterium aurantiibacter]
MKISQVEKLKQKVQRKFLKPVANFVSKSTAGSLFLLVATLAAVFIANSSYADWYHHFWKQKFGFSFDGQLYLEKDLHHWINDGLMAIFFFVVGLELKREIVAGELSEVKKAALPIFAALGGMLVPAAIFLVFNHDNPQAVSGWGIPMATDIAFALGIIYFLGDRIPDSLKVFLAALAIADDLGAVLVIAFFYTSEIELTNLGVGALFLLVLLLANRLGVRNTAFYGIIGVSGVWLSFLLSGVHATIAAVLIAFTIPSRTKIEETEFAVKMKEDLSDFETAEGNEFPTLTSEQLHLLERMNRNIDAALTPSQKLEYKLHPIVAFLILPIFAFANAGVTVSGNIVEQLLSNVALGVALGLVLGKVIGVFLTSYLLLRLKWVQLPVGVSLYQLFGVSFLAAIGFTMSLFVTELAFTDAQLITEAKVGIFAASLLGGSLGYLLLSKNKSNLIVE